jgi:LPXTG-site transpeptidase (sortase) family protein
MPPRTLALGLLFLLFTSFHGLPSEGGLVTAHALVGPPLAATHSVSPRPTAYGFLSHTTPVELVIPRIGVDARVEARGLDTKRNLDTPRDFHDVAWYNRGPAPGEPGNALINGHVNWWTGAAVFTHLSALRSGDEILVVREDDSIATFRVTGRTVVAAGVRLPSLFAPSPNATLTLITCTGLWDTARGSDTQRLLVSAVLE